MSIKLIQNENEEGDYLSPKDGTFKVLFIILVTALLDGIQFLLWAIYIPKFQNFSGSLELRLGGILTILTAILCYYLLKFPIYKHQIFSIILVSLISGSCLISCIFITKDSEFSDNNSITLNFKDKFYIVIILIFVYLCISISFCTGIIFQKRIF